MLTPIFASVLASPEPVRVRHCAGSHPTGAAMIEGLIAGTLVGLAETRQGKNETRFALGKVKATAGDGESLMVNVIAFSTEAMAALMALDDGDAVALSGALTPKVWTDKQGNTRPALDMIASNILTVFHANQKRATLAGPADSSAP
jgi:single-stranded DNA-binding protein